MFEKTFRQDLPPAMKTARFFPPSLLTFEFICNLCPPSNPTLLLDKFNSWIFLLVMLLVSTSMHSSVRTLLGKQRLVTFTNLSIPAITSYSRVSVSLLFLREIL